MREHCLVLVILTLMAASAFASDGVAPKTNSISPHDRLVRTPMTCMMPPLPSLMLDNSETPLDIAKLGAAELSDFVQNTAIYLGCLGMKAKIIVTNLYIRFADFVRAKRQANAPNKRDPEN